MPINTTLKNLGEMPLAVEAVIQGFQSDDQYQTLNSRLQHSGFVRGESVEIVRRGYGKRGNLVVRLGGHTHFALRPNEAEVILVALEGASKNSNFEVRKGVGKK